MATTGTTDGTGGAGGTGGAIAQWTVVNGQLPALAVILTPDGTWWVLDGVNDPNEPGACTVFAQSSLVELDPSLARVPGLSPGHAAYRDAPGQPWEVEPFAYEDDEDGEPGS
ncbi:hypothetical protein [Kitasatospora sp. LaBMicrA B282]|uniref:hypothetical protein n=1 Tax=Kitasatospora sp. LaBMicrA B282 TaxID=3420949 RepID=UPI003D0A4607